MEKESEEFGTVTKPGEKAPTEDETQAETDKFREEMLEKLPNFDDVSLAVIGQFINAEIIERNLHLSPTMSVMVSRLRRIEKTMAIVVPENEKLYWDLTEEEEESNVKTP